MNAEHILLKTLLGESEYRSVIYDVEPEMLPRGITTPGNICLKVENMSMFEEVFDAFTEELNASCDKVLAKCKEDGTAALTLDHVPETAHTLAQIAYAVFAFGWIKMPGMIDAIRRDFKGCDELNKNLAQVPAYGSGDELQDSLGKQIAAMFAERCARFAADNGMTITVTSDN